MCTLRMAHLDDNNVRYEALSYAWGDATNKTPICVNGAALSVTGGLEQILRHLRPADWPPRPMWIDAICINQSDVDERNQQVPLMADIYGSAERTVCWLGEHPDLLAALRITQFVSSLLDELDGEPNVSFLIIGNLFG